MNLKEYIESGILEDYCLGLLDSEGSAAVAKMAADFPQIKHEIDAFMHALEHYATEMTSPLPDTIKTRTFDLLENLAIESEKNVHRLPLINKYSDYQNWREIAQHFLPASLDRDMFLKNIRNDETVSQILIWTKVNYPDEVHEQEQESFIILSGRCRCNIGGKVIDLGPGGYLDIPLYAHHNVEILDDEPVLAIVQRIKTAC